MEPTPMTAPKQPTRPASEQAVSDEDVKHGAYDNAGLCYGCGSRKGSAHRERRGGWPCRVELLLAECLRARKAERAAVAWQRSMLDELHGILPPSMTWDGEPKRLAELLSMDGGKADRLAAAERVVDKAATEHCYNRPNALCGKCAACLAREYRR